MATASLARVEDTGRHRCDDLCGGAIAPARLPSRIAARHAERVYVACDCLLDISAAFFNVSARDLRRPGRCSDDISRVRQIAMYCAHTVLRFTMSDVGKGFGRDRTTVMHACHIVEDLRDDPDFEAILLRIEQLVAAAFRGREGFPAALAE